MGHDIGEQSESSGTVTEASMGLLGRTKFRQVRELRNDWPGSIAELAARQGHRYVLSVLPQSWPQPLMCLHASGRLR